MNLRFKDIWGFSDGEDLDYCLLFFDTAWSYYMVSNVLEEHASFIRGHIDPEDGQSKFLQNVHNYVPVYTVSQPSNPQLKHCVLGLQHALYDLDNK